MKRGQTCGDTEKTLSIKYMCITRDNNDVTFLIMVLTTICNHRNFKYYPLHLSPRISQTNKEQYFRIRHDFGCTK